MEMNSNNSHYFLWLDLETTGFNENNGAILEVGWILTNQDNLETIDQNHFVCHCPNWKELADPVVIDMHEKSGLAEALKETNPALLQVELKLMQVLADIKRRCSPTVPQFNLAGGSIHFDRKWVEKHMTFLESILHYRMLDVSSLKLAFGRHGLPPDKKQHRALKDAQESLDTLIHYRSLLNYDKE